MLFNPVQEHRLESLSARLRLAPEITSDLFSDTMAVCARIALLAKAGKTAHLDGLVRAEAWTDAALTLIALEMPSWKLRRLEYEDGEWLCSLSTQPHMPIAIDDTADARHEVSSLAILNAFLDARRKNSEVRETRSLTTPRLRPASGVAVCCDNFA
jgi:hypothetical protein